MHRTWKRPAWAKGLTDRVSDTAIKRTEQKVRQNTAENQNGITKVMGQTHRRKDNLNKLMGW